MIDLIAIGGGVTGCAVARDATLRGLSVLLVEQDELGAGTSGRFHGMLQSGARYVSTDAEYAAQCMRERRIIERTAPHVRINTGGLFVQLPDDPAHFADQFPEACRGASIPCRRLAANEVAAREPALVPVAGGYEVPDAVFMPWKMVTALAEDAAARGATIRTRVRVTAIRDKGETCQVELRDDDGVSEQCEARAVVIAAGPWAGPLSAMAGQTVPLELAKGSMLIINKPLVSAVVNRCRPPGSFDIMVPFGDVSIFGTTSRDVNESDAIDVDNGEEAELVAGAVELMRDVAEVRLARLSTYAGVRPLASLAPGPDGAVSRRHVVIGDNATAVWTVVGGSFTSHRAMAEDVIDQVCARLGKTATCTTDTVALPPARGRFSWSSNAQLRPDLFGAAAVRGSLEPVNRT